MRLKILVTREIEIDESKLTIYAKKALDRFALEEDHPVNMADILCQAGLDGDIDLPDDWDLQDYDDDLTLEEIKGLEKATE